MLHDTSAFGNGPRPVHTARAKLLKKGVLALPQILNLAVASALRRRLFHLERVLSSLPDSDMRWCKRYCKNMALFSPHVQAFSQAIGRFVAKYIGAEQLYLMNDELSLNVWGERLYTPWHLDYNAWEGLPSDAWAWTIYVPLDRATEADGGGWLRFREQPACPPCPLHCTCEESDNVPPANEWNEYFDRGDVLIFDRWAWHKLVAFSHPRLTRAAHIIRVTNDTRFVSEEGSGLLQPAVTKVLKNPSGWQIQSFCRPRPDHPACRLPLLGPHATSFLSDQHHFIVDTHKALNDSETVVGNSLKTVQSKITRYQLQGALGRVKAVIDYMRHHAELPACFQRTDWDKPPLLRYVPSQYFGQDK